MLSWRCVPVWVIWHIWHKNIFWQARDFIGSFCEFLHKNLKKDFLIVNQLLRILFTFFLNDRIMLVRFSSPFFKFLITYIKILGNFFFKQNMFIIQLCRHIKLEPWFSFNHNAGLIKNLQAWKITNTIYKPVSYTHLRAHETPEHLVCRLLLEKKKK